MQFFTEEEIIHTLKFHRNIAVVGISEHMYRPSYGVTLAMINNGYNIFPVNPKYEKVFDRRCYNTLLEIEEPIEIVNIFRRPQFVLPVVEEAIQIKAKVIWMQLGVVNNQAARLAKDAGLIVIMDRCIKIEYAMNRDRILA